MTDSIPAAVHSAFGAHEALTQTDAGYEITSTVFDGYVTASEGPDWKHTYTVTVFVPTLQAATADDVGPAVLDGWQETLERRLEDAPKSTRSNVELYDFAVEQIDEEVQITYTFEWGDEKRAAAIAKTFVEYVEGTYVEGIIPGYEYEPPVADLLANASTEGKSGTPL